jgi:hypothetical protein
LGGTTVTTIAERLRSRVAELEGDSRWEVTAVSGMDGYPDPDPLDGHAPDYVAETAFGELLVGVVADPADNSPATLRRQEALRGAAAGQPRSEFEVTWTASETD